MNKISILFMLIASLLLLPKISLSYSEEKIIYDNDFLLSDVEGCNDVIKTGKLDMSKAKTILCMENYLLEGSGYPEDLSILFVNKLNSKFYSEVKKNTLFNKVLLSLNNSYTLYPELVITLLKAGATSSEINLETIKAFKNLDCKNITNRKAYSQKHPVTLMCLVNTFNNEEYSNEDLISILDSLRSIKHPIKKKVLNNILINLTSNFALERLPVIKKLLASGVTPEKINAVDSYNLGNHTDALCQVRKWVYDYQHEYLIKHIMPPAVIDLNYLLTTASCHRIICNELIIELANRNKRSVSIGNPLHNLFYEFGLSGGDNNIVKALITPENINSLDRRGNTPLHYLVEAGINHDYIDTMKLLIEAGADIYIKNKDGKSVNDLISGFPNLHILRKVAAKVKQNKIE